MFNNITLINKILSDENLFNTLEEIKIKFKKMNKDKILNEAQKRLKGLSKYKISIANEFLKLLEEKESRKATEELLNIPGFYEKFLEAKQQLYNNELYDFEELKRNV